MSSTIDSASLTSIQTLTKSIIENFDSNKDGQFSADEFGSFLNAFVKSLTGSQTTPASSTGATTNPSATFLSALESASTATTSASSSASETLPECMIGWSRKKWYDPTHTTVKYTAGRIMARYSPSDWLNDTTREKILADFRAAGLNPTAAGKDRCDFGDGFGEVDIVRAANLGGKAWRWGVVKTS